MRATPLRDRHAPGIVPATGSSLPNTNRRRFLLGAGGVAAAAAAVGAAPALAAKVQAPVAADPAGKGYQDTEHVRDYYATTRI